MSVRAFGDAELEAVLRDAGSLLRFPPAADLVPAVRARIASGPRASGWAALWSRPLDLAPALATLVILALATLAFQPVAATAAEALGLRGLPIFRVAETPSPAPTRSAGASPSLIPGATRVASVDEAARLAGFAVLVPAALGAPDEVYVRNDGRVAEVSLLYRPRPGLPASRETGVGALLTEVRGALEPAFFGKIVGPTTSVEQLTIDGRPAAWISGSPHEFFYRDASGEILPATVRLAGNVLAWNEGSLLLRLEADVTRDEAVRIAVSAR